MLPNLKLSKFIDERKIHDRVQELGAEITKRFKGEPLVAIGVLKGSFMFFADLIRAIDQDLVCEFLAVSSYEMSASSGEVKLHLDLTNSVQNKHVLLIEDIVDTGLTMNYLKAALQLRKPKSITTATLLLKPGALKEPCEVDYVGFEITNTFVVGYGLDYNGHYRHLPYIAQVHNIN